MNSTWAAASWWNRLPLSVIGWMFSQPSGRLCHLGRPIVCRSVGRRSVHGSRVSSWKRSARALECMPLLNGTRQLCGRTHWLLASGYARAVAARVTVPSRGPTWQAGALAFLGTPQIRVWPVGHLCHCSGIHSHLSELPCSLVKHIPTAKISSLNIPAKFHASNATRIFKNSNAVTPRDESIKCSLVAQFFAVFWCFCVKCHAHYFMNKPLF